MHARRKSLVPDFTIQYEGTIALFIPTNERAKRWLRRTAPEDANFLGANMAVEPRYLQNVIDAANEEGFIVD